MKKSAMFPKYTSINHIDINVGDDHINIALKIKAIPVTGRGGP
jgi:hypothetical protein